MKKVFYLAFVAAMVIAGCNKNDKPGPVGPIKPDVTVDNPFSGEIKAGDPSAVTIKGQGFDEEIDQVWLTWPDADTMALELVDNPSLEIRETRISFGVHCYSASKGKTVKAILTRIGCTEPVELTGDINVKTPEISDGFIPDQQFYADLTCKNPGIKAITGTCGLIDVNAALDYFYEPEPGEGWPFDISWAVSGDWRGLELFDNLGKKRPVESMAPFSGETVEPKVTDGEYMNCVCWFSKAITEMDFSNWNAYVQLRAGSCTALKKVILGPNMKGGTFDGCTSLEYLDLHLAKAVGFLQDVKNLKYADLRVPADGTGPGTTWNHWGFSGNVKGITFTNDATILIDEWVLQHDLMAVTANNNDTRVNIENAWKNGATVKIYTLSGMEYVKDAPTYAEDPDFFKNSIIVEE